MSDTISCPACGQILRVGTATCLSCGSATAAAAAAADQAATVAPFDAGPSVAPPPPAFGSGAVPPPPPPPTIPGMPPVTNVGSWAYGVVRPDVRRISVLATATQIALGIMAVLSVVNLVFLSMERSLLRQVDDPLAVSFDDLAASDARLGSLGALTVLGMLVTAVLIAVWLYRAYSNLEAFGATTLRHTKPLVAAGWFIPIANLFVPYQAMKSVWIGSDPDGASFYGEWWKNHPVPSILKVWWGLFLLANAISWQSATQTTQLYVEWDTDAALGANQSSMLADVLLVFAALCAIVVVRRWTARQHERAALLGAEV